MMTRAAAQDKKLFRHLLWNLYGQIEHDRCFAKSPGKSMGPFFGAGFADTSK